jgi:CheY-like chemotaxis protein
MATSSEPGLVRILVIEDCEDHLFLLRIYLKDRGFEVDTAPDGSAGVAKFIGGIYDIVLMDVHMPVMDGYCAIRAIRKWEHDNHSRTVPILALTADGLKGDAEKGRIAGCTAFLTKPITEKTLLAAISLHTNRNIRMRVSHAMLAFVPRYLRNVRLNMGDILAGIDRSDYELAQTLGHRMKGSGTSYGFPEITFAGAAVEMAAKSVNGTEIRRQILALGRSLDQTAMSATPA